MAFERGEEVDFSFEHAHGERFRGNLFRQRGSLALSLRRISPTVRTLEELGLPASLRDLMNNERGLVLIAGATGSGKTTTASALLDEINSKIPAHIITIEDPIEVLHPHKRCLVSQREVGRDTPSFSSALRAALREDPDVIFVGEMRDVETTRLALLAAETGHLVISTLHASSAPKAVDRVIDIFPPHEQPQVRALFADTLSIVLAQELIPRSCGGVTPLAEILVATPAVRSLIREGRVHQLENVMHTSTRIGMQTREQHLQLLCARGVVREERSASREGGERRANG
jgi:twitching motility protein PilT